MKNQVRKPLFSSRKCIACWKCVEECPRKAIGRISFLWHRHAIPRYAACVGCMKCVAICPNGCFRKPE